MKLLFIFIYSLSLSSMSFAKETKLRKPQTAHTECVNNLISVSDTVKNVHLNSRNILEVTFNLSAQIYEIQTTPAQRTKIIGLLNYLAQNGIPISFAVDPTSSTPAQIKNLLIEF